MTATASLAHYVLPTTVQYERPDIPITLGFPLYLDAWSQYTPAIVKPPQDADVVDDWYVFWSLAKRLKLPLDYAGVPLDMNKPPTSEDLLRLSMGSAMISLDELKLALTVSGAGRRPRKSYSPHVPAQTAASRLHRRTCGGKYRACLMKLLAAPVLRSAWRCAARGISTAPLDIRRPASGIVTLTTRST